MLVSEEEAVAKWCPFVKEPRINPKADLATGRERGFGCVASGCMAWRWGEWKTAGISGASPRMCIYDDQQPTKGYCGLAGRP